ncbi:guanylate-binding protein 1-like isoform X2 [Psammomys obesus]|uniref:guanylate-binding protein 1-like isoform X2 n=1 Tax=Psammomys obesus TaxID=48139 RepID=UPI002452CE49|nr:guanylate-binding protein 1-like isoform X2 [Psammomys obesus]
MWCLPHPQKAELTLVLLDTEGLGDVEKGDSENDSWIFALAILLSSTFIYNSMGAINQQAMDQLQYVTELTERIRSTSPAQSSGAEDSEEFVNFFPDFVWALRDVTVRLDADGQALSADQYLENSLKLKQEWRKLSKLESLQDNELDSDFVRQVAEFCSFVLSSSKAKALPGGIEVNGARLEILVLTYLNAINSGTLPCVENAVLALSQIENSAAVQKAITHYNQQMSQRVQLPTETLQELLDLHRACEREAMDIFLRNAFKDEDHSFKKELLAQLERRWDGAYKENVRASSARCSELLRNIFSPLEEAMARGAYSQPGGYLLFVEKREELKQKYLREPRKGIQAEEILQAYLQSSEAMAEAILQRDQALTVKQKEIEVERAKADSAQAAVKTLEEMKERHAQMMMEKERCHQERVRQLTEKMKRERAQFLQEQERVLALKLQEQEELIKKGWKEESIRLQNEIQALEKRNRERVQEEAESAQAVLKMLEDKYKMGHNTIAQEGEPHWGHMKQLSKEKQEFLECQVAMAPGTMEAPPCV